MAAALAVAQHPVQLAVIFIDLPRPIVVEQLQAVEQFAAGQFGESRPADSGIAVPAQCQLRQRGIQAAEISIRAAPADGKIAFLGEGYGPCGSSTRSTSSGNQEIEIGIALAVGMEGILTGTPPT